MEVPVQATANGMEGLVNLQVSIELRFGNALSSYLEAAQVGIAIFGPNTEIVGYRIFNAATDGPAPVGFVVRVKGQGTFRDFIVSRSDCLLAIAWCNLDSILTLDDGKSYAEVVE